MIEVRIKEVSGQLNGHGFFFVHELTKRLHCWGINQKPEERVSSPQHPRTTIADAH